MLIGYAEQEVARSSEAFKTHANKREKRTITSTQGPVLSEGSGKQWAGVGGDLPPRVKDKLLHLLPPATQSQMPRLACPLRFWRQQRTCASELLTHLHSHPEGCQL